ncbi:MAG TPA: teicoplanin resistance protein VanZ [Candidatus Marinimicrobia bacterium]|nr:teicoplanin resistance protein VanZ [Candidatus Neomarinimicrobiota bacterium]HIB33314.1 teicoplanin resistance protein VanZ [Candidatus Neomarinimicrobiota bacterium]
MNRNKVYFFGYLGLILLGSSIPGTSVPDIFLLSWDKLLHVMEYSIVGVLGIRAFSSTWKQPIYGVITIGVVFGIVDELYQGMIPGRFTSSIDVLADGIGVIFGSMMTKYYLHIKYG